VLLTPTAWEILKTKAEDKGISISELIEQWARKTTL
jgi:predicted transcriptional regulator